MNHDRNPSLSSPSTLPLSPRTSSRARNHLFAGSLGGLLSSVSLQPLDVIKTRLQQGTHPSLPAVIKSITQNNILNLWRGTGASVIRSSIGSGLYFLTLNELRSYFGTSSTSNLTTGAFARAAVGTIMMPVTIIKVRYESNFYNYSSLMHAIRDIYGTHGTRGFFYGALATAVRDAPYAGLYVLVYETLRGQAPSQGVVTNFGAGLVAGFSATVVTNPFDVLRTRMQLKPDQYVSISGTLRKLVSEEGGRSLFDGVGLRIARKSLSSALTWTLYEYVLSRTN